MNESADASPDIEVLVVDDEEGIRGVLTDMIKYFGYKPVAFGSAEEAAAELENHNFKFAVIDIILPGMTGLDLAKILRLKKPEILILLTGGYDKYIEPEEMEKLGVSGFISKPFKMKRIQEILQELL